MITADSIEVKIALNPRAWAAFDSLVDRLRLTRQIEIRGAAIEFFKALSAIQTKGSAEGVSVEPLPPLAQILLVIAYLHVTTGSPLFVNDALADAFEQRYTDGNRECSGCGLRHPTNYRACVLCGRATGEIGIWSRGGRAVLN